ncbi:MAG: hypothetical protein ACOX17_03665 [Christensenellales bacterium]|jgi:Zn ribbon nucleic-acid-binding protein
MENPWVKPIIRLRTRKFIQSAAQCRQCLNADKTTNDGSVSDDIKLVEDISCHKEQRESH